jgi:uncharacterized protein (TIGR02757 family)
MLVGLEFRKDKNMFDLKAYLDDCVEKFEKPDFIADDPISIPHRFSKLQDVEIMALWTSILAWGQRKSIMNSANRLVEMMDNAPHDFMLNHEEKDRSRFEPFKHRTFQTLDTLYFLTFFQEYYKKNNSLEDAFARHLTKDCMTVEKALIGFHNDFFDHEYAPQRTRKHVATPERGSTCKRLNMFLRWMVRSNEKGVDFGLWEKIDSSLLLLPLDVHVDRVARRFGLIQREKSDWKTVLELGENLRKYDPKDPAKYDFALFGIGILEKNAPNTLDFIF